MAREKTYFRYFKNIQIQPKRFEYRPRTFDPDKAAFEKRKRRIERELAMEQGKDVPYEEGHYEYRGRWARESRSTRARAKKSSIIRLLIILTILLSMSYLALQWLQKFE